MRDLNKELILEIFYSTKGDLDKINAAIESRLQRGQIRKISIFEKYLKGRLSANPRVLKMINFEINPLEAVYLSQYPAIEGVEILDLRKNSIGDEGLEALAHSPLLKNLRELDVRNNQISRLGMVALSKSKTLTNLRSLDLRANKLGKRWEEKLKTFEVFSQLEYFKTI